MALMNENFSDLLTVGEEAFLLLVVFDNYMETAFAPKNADWKGKRELGGNLNSLNC